MVKGENSMKIEHLRYFQCFANAKSINQAAKELYISQQHLNRILTSLENDLHVTLFERSNRGMVLTEDGQKFAKYAGKILTEYSAMQNYFFMRRTDVEPLGEHSISGKCTLIVPPFISVFLSDMINKFKEVAPNIILTCLEDSSQITESSVTTNHLHFLGYYIDEEILERLKGKINIIPIIQSRTYLCVNKENTVAHLKEIDTELGMTLVNTVSPISPVSTFCPDKLIFSSSNVYQHLDSVVQNGTVCTMPDIILPKLKPMYPDVVTIPFTDGAGSPCSIVYPSTYVLSEADEVLISFLKVYFQNLQLIAQQAL